MTSDAILSKNGRNLTKARSSTQVGRGNYHNQSWPNVLERFLREAVPNDVHVEVRNFGVGAQPSFPTFACLRDVVGGGPCPEVLIFGRGDVSRPPLDARRGSSVETWRFETSTSA